MKYFFDTQNLLTTNSQKAFTGHPLTIHVAGILFTAKNVASQLQYQKILGKIINAAQKSNPPPTKVSIHPKEIPAIKKHKALTEETVWGGVSLKKVDVEKDFIQKLLVVNKYGILGFEFHKQKL